MRNGRGAFSSTFFKLTRFFYLTWSNYLTEEINHLTEEMSHFFETDPLQSEIQNSIQSEHRAYSEKYRWKRITEEK